MLKLVRWNDFLGMFSTIPLHLAVIDLKMLFMQWDQEFATIPQLTFYQIEVIQKMMFFP